MREETFNLHSHVQLKSERTTEPLVFFLQFGVLGQTKFPYSTGELLVSPPKKFHVPNCCSRDDDVMVTNPDRSRNYFCVCGGFRMSSTISGFAVMFPKNFICFFRFFVFENFPNFRVCLEFVDGHSIFTTGS